MTHETLRLLGVGLAIALGLGAVSVWRSRGESPPLPQTMPSVDVPPTVSETPSAPPPREPAAAPPTPPPPASKAAPRNDLFPADETALMVQLREIASQDAARAIELAEDGNRRYPDSADAPERTAILVHALAAEGRGSEARGQAEFMNFGP